MKKLFEILTDESKSFNLPGWAWAVIMPVAIIMLLGVAGYMDMHGM